MTSLNGCEPGNWNSTRCGSSGRWLKMYGTSEEHKECSLKDIFLKGVKDIFFGGGSVNLKG